MLFFGGEGTLRAVLTWDKVSHAEPFSSLQVADESVQEGFDCCRRKKGSEGEMGYSSPSLTAPEPGVSQQNGLVGD